LIMLDARADTFQGSLCSHRVYLGFDLGVVILWRFSIVELTTINCKVEYDTCFYGNIEAFVAID